MSFLFVDRIVEHTPGQVIRGLKHITRDDNFLIKDERGDYVFAPSLIGETLGQLAAWSVMSSKEFAVRPVAGIVSSARLFRSAHLGSTLLLEAFIEHLDDTSVQYRAFARIQDETVFSVEGAIGPLLPMENFIDKKTVVRQFEAINRPGDWTTYLNNQEKTQAFKRENVPSLSPSFDF